MSFFLISYLFLFALITWRRFDLGLFFLFFLLPVYLIRFSLGPIPTTLLEAMFYIIFIIWLLKKYNISYLLSLISKIKTYPSFFIAITLFLIAATISIFTSIDARAALGEWKAFYIEPILLFLVLITALKTKKQIDTILFALILSGFLTSLLAIYQKYTGWYVPWEYWENRHTFRVTGWYGFPNGVGLFLAPLVPLAIYLVKNCYHKLKELKRSKKQEARNKQITNDKIKTWLIFVSCILYLVSSLPAIFFARSTGGLVGAAAGIIFLLLVHKKTRWPTVIIGLASFVGLVGLNRLSNIRQELFLQDRSGQIRIEMWSEAIEFLRARPVAGAGLASYQTLIYPYRIDKWIEVFHHPHNLFLTMWVNLGLLGLIGFVWILVWFYRVGLKNLQPTSYKLQAFLLASMTTLLTTGLVDSPYIKNDLALFFWLLPALMVVASGQNEKNIVD